MSSETCFIASQVELSIVLGLVENKLHTVVDEIYLVVYPMSGP